MLAPTPRPGSSRSRLTTLLAAPCAALAAASLLAPTSDAQLSILRKGKETVDVPDYVGDRMGEAVCAGDFNGDGRDDLAIAIPGEPEALNRRGRVVVNNGTEFGITWPSSRDLTPDDFGHPTGADVLFGHALCAADLDQDGFDELIVSAPLATVSGQAEAGLIAVYSGSASGLLAAPVIFRQSDFGGLVEAGDRFGWSLDAGTLGADSYPDLAIGAVGENGDRGAVVLAFSSSGGLTGASQIFTATDLGVADQAGAEFGFSVCITPHLFNGFHDLAVGAPGFDLGGQLAAGRAYVIGGGGAGVDLTDVQEFDASDFGQPYETMGWFGYRVDSGHFDDEIVDSVAIAWPGWNGGEGRVALLDGGINTSTPELGVTIADAGLSATADERFGFSIAVGDFNNDGYDDLGAGVPFRDLGSGPVVSDAGVVTLIKGGTNGLGDHGSDFWAELDAGGLFGDKAEFGFSMCFGKFTNDFRESVVVGSPWKDTRRGHVYNIAPWRQAMRPNSTSGMALNCDRQALWAQKPHERVKIASTTKIMTVLLACEWVQAGLIELDDEYAIEPWLLGAFPPSTGCSAFLFQFGEIISIENLMYAALMPSGNDACYALADAITGEAFSWNGHDGTVPIFVSLMNARAAQLGMDDTLFTNPAGVDTADPYSSAWDMLLLASEAMDNDLFEQIVSTTEVDFVRTFLIGQNLVQIPFSMSYGWLQAVQGYAPTANGLKPGGTPGAQNTGVFGATSPVLPFEQVLCAGFGTPTVNQMHNLGARMMQLGLADCGYDLPWSAGGNPEPPDPNPIVPVGGLTAGPNPTHGKATPLAATDELTLQLDAVGPLAGQIDGTVTLTTRTTFRLQPGEAATFGAEDGTSVGLATLRNQSETETVDLDVRTSHPSQAFSIQLPPNMTYEQANLTGLVGAYEMTITNLESEPVVLGFQLDDYEVPTSFSDGTGGPGPTRTITIKRHAEPILEGIDFVLDGFVVPGGGGVEVAAALIEPGTPYVFDPCAPRWSHYGTGTAGTDGVPELFMDGAPILGTTPNTLLGNSAGTATTTYVVMGFSAVDLFAKGGQLYVTPTILLPLPLPTDGLAVPTAIPNDPLLCGVSLYVQHVPLDAGGPVGFAFSRGLRITFGD